ncbi:hypothetical protein DDD63_06925 [Actinobaculum sp. 313]|nr:hypothetical protein DDD63_06925 [Actinobaculum sp. 313]
MPLLKRISGLAAATCLATAGFTAVATVDAPEASAAPLCYTRVLANGGWAKNNTCGGWVQYVDRVKEKGKVVSHYAKKVGKGKTSSNWVCWGDWVSASVLASSSW